MVSTIQECAPPGPTIGSISFDFVTKMDGTALVRRGDRQAPLVKLFRCFPGSPELDWPAWHRNRICKDAFDWQTKGSAGDRRGLNLAWRPDVNGLAMQSQMAKRPSDAPELQLSSTLMSKPLPHHCQQDLFRPRRVFHTLAPQDQPRHTHQRCRGCQNPPQHYWSLAVGRGRPSSVRRTPELLRGRALAKLWPPSASFGQALAKALAKQDFGQALAKL